MLLYNSIGHGLAGTVVLGRWLDLDDHRIPARYGLEGTSVGHPAQPPAKAGSPRAGCTGPCPGGS